MKAGAEYDKDADIATPIKFASPNTTVQAGGACELECNFESKFLPSLLSPGSGEAFTCLYSADFSLAHKDNNRKMLRILPTKEIKVFHFFLSVGLGYMFTSFPEQKKFVFFRRITLVNDESIT